MKKGRHRRYEEARKFHRDSAAQFDIENYDFEAGDGFSDILESNKSDDNDDALDDEYEDLDKKYDPYSDLAQETDAEDEEDAESTSDDSR